MMLDHITLVVAKRYADEKANNIVCDGKRTLHLDANESVEDSPVTSGNIVGSTITLKGEYYNFNAPQKADTELIASFNIGSSYINIFYGNAELFDKSVIILGGDTLGVISICPRFTFNIPDYDALVYCVETTSDTVGLGITLEPGWYMLSSEALKFAPFDVEANPIIIRPELYDSVDLSPDFFKMAEQHDEITFKVQDTDMYTSDMIDYVLPAILFGDISSKLGDITDKSVRTIVVQLTSVLKLYEEYVRSHTWPLDIEYPFIKQLDQKFIPPVDSLTFKSSTEGSTKKLKMTVDDTGKATVTDGADVNVTYGGGAAGAEVFYIDLAGNYPDYTCPVAMADIKAAYEAGKVLECRCMMGDLTATLPLFVPMPDASLWIFSGAGTSKEMGFVAQSFTVVIRDGIVLADHTQLVDANGELPNPHSLTITNGRNRVTYDGREPVSISIPASENFASKQEAQGYVTAHNEDTAAHQDIRTALTAIKPKACLVILGSSDWDAIAKTQVVTVSSVVADEATQMIHPIPKIGQVTDYNAAGIQLVGRGAGNVTFMCDTIPEKDIEVWVVTEDVEDVTPLPYLTFSSPQPFTLRTASGKQWNGTLEYSYDTSTWTTWDGSTSLQPPEGYRLYMRGIGNTKITGFDSKWELTGTDIACAGNIENLLDYTVVKRGKHPVMATYCYRSMFANCSGLTTAPELPATTLANHCYDSMFANCRSLTTAPELPATTLAMSCYDHMFDYCLSLTTAPELPATTLADHCYDNMFRDCRSLTTAPSLPATTLANGCYTGMFYSCRSLKLSTTATDSYTIAYRIPSAGEGTSGQDSLTNMFTDTGGTFVGTPEINTTYYLDKSNSIA